MDASGAMATAHTAAVWPTKDVTRSPVSRFLKSDQSSDDQKKYDQWDAVNTYQTTSCLSIDPLAPFVPSGVTAKLRTPPVPHLRAKAHCWAPPPYVDVGRDRLALLP